jgi:hypothetical protein
MKKGLVINDKLSSLEEKYIANKIAQSSYKKWYPVYNRELNEKKGELADLNKNDSETLKRYETYLPYLSDLNLVYGKATVENKQPFLKGIFLGGFTKEKIGGRTDMINPMFYQNALNISTLLRVSKMEKPEFSSGFPTCTQRRTRTGMSAKTLVFETSASTDSASWAFGIVLVGRVSHKRDCKTTFFSEFQFKNSQKSCISTLILLALHPLNYGSTG